MTKWQFVPEGAIDGGRCTIWLEPERGRTYSLGLDFAHGLEESDYDAGVVLRDDGEQAATLHGRWGMRFEQIILPFIEWYRPFVVGEWTTTGLDILPRLYHAGHWVYFQRKEQTRGRKAADQFGHVPTHRDVTIQMLRRDLANYGPDGKVRPSRLKIRDEAVHAELCAFGFRPRSQRVTIADVPDADLVWGAPPGEHDDLVRALALAVAGLEWLPAYDRPKLKLPEGSIGKVLGFDREPEKPKGYWG